MKIQEVTEKIKDSLQTSLQIGQNQADSIPPELVKIIQLWPDLPEYIRAAIKALLDSVKAP